MTLEQAGPFVGLAEHAPLRNAVTDHVMSAVSGHSTRSLS
jgi:hypothetical protein